MRVSSREGELKRYLFTKEFDIRSIKDIEAGRMRLARAVQEPLSRRSIHIPETEQSCALHDSLGKQTKAHLDTHIGKDVFHSFVRA